MNEALSLLGGLLIWIVFPISILLNIFFIIYFILYPLNDEETAEEKREYSNYRHWRED